MTYNGSGYPGTFTIRACRNVKILDCHFYDCGADGVLIAAWGTDDDCENVIIRAGLRSSGATEMAWQICGLRRRDGGCLPLHRHLGAGHRHRAGRRPVVRGQLRDFSDGNVIESGLGAESVTVADHWNQAIGISSVVSWSATEPSPATRSATCFLDAYLATAAAEARYPQRRGGARRLGPVVFSNNSIVTNRLSDIGGKLRRRHLLECHQRHRLQRQLDLQARDYPGGRQRRRTCAVEGIGCDRQ